LKPGAGSFLIAAVVFLIALPACFRKPAAAYWNESQVKERGHYADHYQLQPAANGGTIRKKTKRGTWQYYYRNGTLAKIEHYGRHKDRANLPHGKWQWYDSSGVLIRLQRFKRRGLEKDVRFVGEGNFEWDDLRWEVEAIGRDSFSVHEYRNGALYRRFLQFDGILLLRTATAPAARSSRGPEPVVTQVHNPDILPSDEIPLTKGRNLIANPSFEHTSVDWPELTAINIADTLIDNWKPASGTPDYMRGRKAPARDGSAVAGIRIYSRGAGHIEYIQGQLTQPLQPDTLYCVKVHFRLSGRSALAADAVGVHLSRDSFRFYQFAQSGLKAHILNKPGQLLFYADRWMQLSGTYRALGGERFITIGGFREADSIHAVRVSPNGQAEAYYFIDDLQLYRADAHGCKGNTHERPPAVNDQPVREVPDTPLVLQAVQFKANSAELDAAGKEELDELAAWMLARPLWALRVEGHTDSSGREDANLVLSARRAAAVGDYLISKGLAPERIRTLGQGSRFPMRPNNSPENRALNRRVEVAFFLME
jgi:outer membrane protein OmpA-like peptidoglycan-associated protein